MEKIKLLNLGGTITSSIDPTTGELNSGTLTGEELMKQSGLDNLNLNLDIENFMSIPSPEMTINNIKDLGKRVMEIIEEEKFQGIVIMHGTDTMEETAYLLDLITDTKIPIVITGSQRSVKDLGFDGSGNIRDAIIVASDKKSRNKGVLIVFDQEILTAKLAFKSNSTGLKGFTASGTGPIGVVYGGKAKYYYDYIPNKPLEISDEPFTNRVHLLKMTLDYPVDIIYSLIDIASDGIIIEGFGVGSAPPDVQDAIEQAIKNNIPVILTTRCETGGVRPVYGTKGGGVQLKRLGVIFEEYLSGQKTRLKLIAMLNSPYRNELEKYWNSY